MKLLLLRHAEAVPARVAGSDDHRWLTTSGRRCARAVGAALRAEGLTLTHAYSSPLVRAIQTSELIVAALGFTDAVVVHTPLATGPTAAVLEPLTSHLDDDVIAFIGHEPIASTVAGQLAGVRFPGYPTGTACLFTGDPEAGLEFAWAIDPRTGARVDSPRALSLY
ncbi:MAG: histidine phosphatase family protein [Nannocystaceae bacterium]|nr:histidine phosphatase family protein [Myxococcales bacterium]